MKQYIKSAFKTFYDGIIFKGKATKQEYVAYIFFMILFPTITYLVAWIVLILSKYISIFTNISHYIISLSAISILIPFLSLPALTVRRLNDANKSKLFLILLIIPIFIPTILKLLVWLIILIYFANMGKNNDQNVNKDKIIKYDQ